MQKCDLGDMGAQKCSKVPKTHFGDFELSEQQNTPYTYAKRKSVFLKFFIFRKVFENHNFFADAFWSVFC